MKLIIAGSRSISSLEAIEEAFKLSGFEKPAFVISGGANGVDKTGEQWARYQGIRVMKFPANWHLYGKSAGYIRNEEMAKAGDALLLVYDGVSRGSKHMLNMAEKHKLLIYVHYTKPTPKRHPVGTLVGM